MSWVVPLLFDGTTFFAGRSTRFRWFLRLGLGIISVRVKVRFRHSVCEVRVRVRFRYSFTEVRVRFRFRHKIPEPGRKTCKKCSPEKSLCLCDEALACY